MSIQVIQNEKAFLDLCINRKTEIKDITGRLIFSQKVYCDNICGEVDFGNTVTEEVVTDLDGTRVTLYLKARDVEDAYVVRYASDESDGDAFEELDIFKHVTCGVNAVVSVSSKTVIFNQLGEGTESVENMIYILE